MPLTRPQPSRATTKAFRAGLSELIELGRAPSGLSEEEALPQRIYTIGLNDIIKGNGVERAKPVMWEFLVSGSRGSPLLVVLGDPLRGRRPRVTNIYRHPFAAETARAVRRVEEFPALKRNRYELRRLRIPAVSISAIWLKSLQKTTDDLAVPYQMIHRQLKGMHPYPMGEFLSVLKPIVQKRIKEEAALERKKKR